MFTHLNHIICMLDNINKINLRLHVRFRITLLFKFYFHYHDIIWVEFHV